MCVNTAIRSAVLGLLMACAVVLAAGAAVYGQDAELTPDALAQRFLAHLQRNQPIAGTFEIETTVDLPKEIRESIEKNGAKSEASRQLLVCRWAWTTDREVCMALDGSKDATHSFLSLPEGTLIGYQNKQYNLLAPGKPGPNINRPALFYHMNGSSSSSESLASCHFTLDSAKMPGDKVNLISTSGDGKSVLTLEKTTGRLHAAEIYHQGKRLWALSVDEFATSADGARVFPKKAKTIVFNPTTNQPLRTSKLTGRTVEFPSEAEVSGEFELPVEAKALIGDRVLNSAIATKAPVSASKIITGDMPREPFTRDDEGESVATKPAQTESYRVRIIAAMFALLLLYVVYHLVARYRRRQAGGV